MQRAGTKIKLDDLHSMLKACRAVSNPSMAIEVLNYADTGVLEQLTEGASSC